MADELDGMATFVAVAEAKGFRAAGERLGVSHSAVSQSLRRLEERLGIALVQRTTRSVRLTDAGEQLYASVRPALDEVRAAVAAVGELGGTPQGTLRLHLTTGAETYFNGPLLAGFLATHPRVRLDLAVSETSVDIVAEGYDAGARLGEVIDKDMIAVPVSGDIGSSWSPHRATSSGTGCHSIRASSSGMNASRGTPRQTRPFIDGSSPSQGQRAGAISQSPFRRAC